MGHLDPGSTGGAVGNDDALQNNLTDPCWLLDRAAQLLHADHHPSRSALPQLGRTMADALSALRYWANSTGEPFGEVVSQTVTHLRFWAGAMDEIIQVEAEHREPRRAEGRAEAPR
jgi:hypothetical protein